MMSFPKFPSRREGKEKERDARTGVRVKKIERIERSKEEGGRRRGRREEKGVEDGGVEFSLYHSSYSLTISYLVSSSLGRSVA